MLAAAILAAACAQGATIVSRPPATLPAALASKYPDGLYGRAYIDVDTHGHIVRIKIDDLATVAPVTATLEALAHSSVFAPAPPACAPTWQAMIDEQFYPPASGVVGVPLTVGGVDLEKLPLGKGPCEGSDFDPSLYSAFSGTVNGALIVVANVHCDFPIAYNAQASIYKIENGNATLMGKSLNYGSPAHDEPQLCKGWMHVNFAADRFYLDTYDSATQKWLATTYTIRSGKLVTLFTQHHGRAPCHS